MHEQQEPSVLDAPIKASAVVVMLVLLSSFMIAAPHSVHAQPALVQQVGGGCSDGCEDNQSTASFDAQVTSANLIVVGMATNYEPYDPEYVFSVSDSLDSSFTLAVQNCISPGQESCVAIYYATAPSTGSDTITVTVNVDESVNSIDIFAYELSGVTAAGATTGTGYGFGGEENTPVSTSATSFTNEAFLLGVVGVAAYEDPTLTPGTGFTASPPTVSNFGFAEYSTSGVGSPTTFPGTLNYFDTWTEVGLALSGSSPTPTPSGVLYGCTSGNGGEEAGPVPTSLSTTNPAVGVAASGALVPSSLYTINPATGAATLIGPMGVNQCSGLDFGPGGILYAGAAAPDDGGDALYTVNTATGAATLVGTSNNCGPPITDLASDPLNGVLYGTQFDCIVTFNLSTGAATLIGSTSGDTDGNGLAFNAAGQLYYADGENLYSVNPANGASSVIAAMTGQPDGCSEPHAIDSMKFNPDGVLYGVLVCASGGGQNWLVTINPATAVISPIGLTGAHMDGIAWSPVSAPTATCPSTTGGVILPVGATFTDQNGNTWTVQGGNDVTYFFAGTQSSIPPPMQQGSAGEYVTYDGQQGWMVSFYCAGMTPPPSTTTTTTTTSTTTTSNPSCTTSTIADSVTFTVTSATYGSSGNALGVFVPVTNCWSTAQSITVYASLKLGTAGYVLVGGAQLAVGQTTTVFCQDFYQTVPAGTYVVTFSALSSTNQAVSAPTTPVVIIT
jgi:hypothetical protein